MSIDPHVLVPILLVCYIAWRMYLRVRRHIGRQPLQPGRLTYRIVIYCAIVLMIAASAAMRNLSLLTGLGGGLALGAALAAVGLRLTAFETTPEGQFYRPNTYIGVGLSALLIGRLIYRLMVFYDMAQIAGTPAGPASASLVQSPLTLLIFGLLFGYYVAYYGGVLMRSKKEKPTAVATSVQ
jgi:hypothetical protein